MRAITPLHLLLLLNFLCSLLLLFCPVAANIFPAAAALIAAILIAVAAAIVTVAAIADVVSILFLDVALGAHFHRLIFAVVGIRVNTATLCTVMQRQHGCCLVCL